jgi:hypothetical protein
VTQPSLDFTLSAPEPRQPRKRVRQVSREAYRQRRALDVALEAAGHESARGKVLRLLAWHWNATQNSPTALELMEWARTKGERLFDANVIRPRLTELFDEGIVETAGKRKCLISGRSAHVWRVTQR